MKFMKKNIIFGFFAITLVFNLTACLNIEEYSSKEPPFVYTNRSADNNSLAIVSPYKDIDWQNFGQYKAALHVHTTNSDGYGAFSKVIDLHYRRGFDIVAITDHNLVTVDWVNAANGLTQERVDAINNGAGRDGRGMIHIPYANEQSWSLHLTTLFANHNNSHGDTFIDTLEKVEELGGIAFLNHLGRYTGGSRWTPMRLKGKRGANASNDDQIIQTFVDLFMKFPSCVGMELVTAKDWETVNDRILWDNILERTIPQGRYVWGFSNDDSHRNRYIGINYNIFLMPENTQENIKKAMFSGSFYAVARTAWRELGNFFTPRSPAPVIVNIEVDDGEMSITINAENYHSIDWISNGRVIASGNTISLESHLEKIGSYVRANIIGYGGVAFTQPFGVIWN